MSDEDRVPVPARGCYVVRRGNHPSLVTHCGECEFELIVGHHVGAAEDAYEFAMDLAYAALPFATRFRYLIYPRHTEAEPVGTGGSDVRASEYLPSALRRHKETTGWNFLAYLATAIRHSAIDHGRRRKHEELEEDIDVLDLDANPMTVTIGHDLKKIVVRAVRTLEYVQKILTARKGLLRYRRWPPPRDSSVLAPAVRRRLCLQLTSSTVRVFSGGVLQARHVGLIGSLPWVVADFVAVEGAIFGLSGHGVYGRTVRPNLERPARARVQHRGLTASLR